MYEKSAEAKLFSYQYTTISEILGVILNDSSFIFEGVIVKTSNIISLRTSQIDFSKGKKFPLETTTTIFSKTWCQNVGFNSILLSCILYIKLLKLLWLIFNYFRTCITL